MKPYIGIFIAIILFMFSELEIDAQTNGQNYIVTTVPFQAVTDPTTLVDANSNTSIQYFDGLGRPSQTVQRAITPTSADLVNGIEYDGFGRDYRHWLPASVSGNSGAYVTDFGTPAVNTNGGDSKPYATTEYDGSPLNRVTGQYGAGTDWYNAGKKQTIEYLTNDATIAYYYVNSDKHLAKDANYAAGSLYVTKATDEDGKVGYEFKDKLGRVILKRQILDGNNVDTYYVYNDLNQLCYVLPPKAVDELTSDLGDDNAIIKQYCYLYQYDERENCIYKRLPGCTPIYMVYDKADRMVLSQDGNQRKKLQNQSAQWTVTKYDALGRVIFTGLMYRNEMDSTLNYKSIRDVISNDVVTESYTGFATATPLTINYYDSYSFISSGNNLNYDSSQEQNGYTAYYSNAKGLLTGTRVYHLDDPTKFETTALYYDKYGRVVQSRASNHLGGYDLVYNELKFTGAPARTLKTHGINGATDTYKELYTYDYDKAQRPTTTKYSLNGSGEVTLASNTYDELGRLKTKTLGGIDATTYSYNVRSWTTDIVGSRFSENLYYNTGPLNGANACYNGNIAAMQWSVANDNLNYNRAYSFTYDNLNRLTNANYYGFSNGSVVSGTTGLYNETLDYMNDKMGNIHGITRNENGTQVESLGLQYQGNQLQKVDNGVNHFISYGSELFKDYDNHIVIPTEYAYDTNGNMLYDANGGVSAIQYNLLNLPDVVQFKNGNQIKNTYNAGGQKLGTEYFTWVPGTNAPVVNTGDVLNISYSQGAIDQNGTVYIGNVEYKTQNGNSSLTTISRIHNAEGYVENLSSPQYYYYRKDHLGNNREVWLANTRSTVQRTQYYLSGLPWVTTWGDNQSTQPYKYNGKEFVEMHGYDTYDYGARGYYAAGNVIPTVDPLAEKYYSISPYAYCAGNPVRYVDLKGMDLFDVTGHFIPKGDNSNRVLIRTNNGNVPLSSLAMNNMSDRQTAANIAGYYGNQIGIHSPGNVGVSNEPIEKSSSSQAFIRGKNIYLNANGGLNKLLDDKNNLMNSLFHEKGHKDLGHGEKETSNLTHAGVYLDQMGDKSFENTTSDFRKQTTNALKNILKDAITYDGAQDSQIQGVVDQYNKLNTGYQISYERTGSNISAYNLTVIQNK